MAISPGMIKILGSIASTAMSSKGKEESKPEPKLNSNFLIDADKQASQAPLNKEISVISGIKPKGIKSITLKGDTSGIENLKKDIPETRSYTWRERKLMDRVDRRKQKRTDRIDSREVRRKIRFDGRDVNEGKTYQEKRGTDVGNFFRRFNDPSASQTQPSNTNSTDNSAYDNYQQKLNTQFLLESDKISARQQELDQGSYKDWLYKDVELAPPTITKNK